MTIRERAKEAFARCSNAGRWGADDERGTLKLITCARYRRAEFLLTAAPLRIPNASGSSVNPVATF